MIDIRQEPEIREYDRDKPQILEADNYVENVHIAVGFASCCWRDDDIFDTDVAIRVSNELCAYMRLFREGRVQ